MRGSGAAIAGVMLTGLACLVVTAAADDVPLPRPTPFARPGQAAAPGARLAAANQPMPPAAIPSPAPPTADPAPQQAAPTGILQALGIISPGTSVVFDAKQRALVDHVNAYLTSLQTVVGNFVQVAPDGSRSDGQFYLMKPGRVRFEYNPPNPVQLIADGQSVLVRDRKLSTQDLYPLSQTPLRFLLADRIDLMKDTNLVAVYADDLFVSLVIEERQVFGGTHRLLLMFGARDFHLRQWTITDPQGLDTTVAIYNLDTTKKLDPGIFEITYQRMLP